MTSKEKVPPCPQNGQGGHWPSWQTDPCPSWCTWQPHDEADHPDDRRHAGKILRRNLSLEQSAEVGKGGHEPEYVAAYLWQQVREIEPRIIVSKGETSLEFHLTLEDAVVVSMMLQGLVYAARGAHS